MSEPLNVSGPEGLPAVRQPASEPASERPRGADLLVVNAWRALAADEPEGGLSDQDARYIALNNLREHPAIAALAAARGDTP